MEPSSVKACHLFSFLPAVWLFLCSLVDAERGGTPPLMSRLASRGFGCGVPFGIHRETDRPCVPTLRRTRSASVRHPDPRLECQTQQPVWGRRRRKIPQAFLGFFAPCHHPCRWTLCHSSSIWYQVSIKYGDSRWTSINSFASQLRSPR